MKPVILHIGKSASFYPITAFYVAAVIILAVTVKGWVTLTVAVTLMALAGVFSLLVATWRELKGVHAMLDGQRAELLGRIDDLTQLLVQNGISPPAPNSDVKDAQQENHTERKDRT